MDAIKGTMTEIYNDLSKSTTGNTIAEVRLILHLHETIIQTSNMIFLNQL